MLHRPLGLLAVLTTLAIPSAAQAVTASVRVEGQSATLLARTTVNLPDTGTFQTSDGQTCPANSVAGAIDAAVGPTGWDRSSFTSTILGETHQFANNDYWAEWLDERYGGGICTDVVGPGDRVLMLVDVSDSGFNPTVFPLAVTGAPSSVVAGQPFTVDVTEYRTTGTPGTGTPTPASGVSVTAGSASATTDTTGRATLTLASAGSYAIRATRGNAGRSEPVAVTATDPAPAGGSGSGSSDPGPTAPEAGPTTAPAEAVGEPAPAADVTAPEARVIGIADGETFGSRNAPRDLRGSIGQPDPSGIATVKLRLTRAAGRRCTYYSASRERFRGAHCGAAHGSWFVVAQTASWSYLLPFRLPRGRYVLDVKAADRAGNSDTVRRRGANRVVFRVL